jgi:hypothetical protein
MLSIDFAPQMDATAAAAVSQTPQVSPGPATGRYPAGPPAAAAAVGPIGAPVVAAAPTEPPEDPFAKMVPRVFDAIF